MDAEYFPPIVLWFVQFHTRAHQIDLPLRQSHFQSVHILIRLLKGLIMNKSETSSDCIKERSLSVKTSTEINCVHEESLCLKSEAWEAVTLYMICLQLNDRLTDQLLLQGTNRLGCWRLLFWNHLGRWLDLVAAGCFPTPVSLQHLEQLQPADHLLRQSPIITQKQNTQTWSCCWCYTEYYVLCCLAALSVSGRFGTVSHVT